MGLPKSKNAVGLGNSLMNDRFGKGKGADMRRGTYNSGAIERKGHDGETYITNAKKEASWVKMRSITEQAALDEFLSTAELAGTEFTAEKMDNVKIIRADQKNPYLLSADEERAVVHRQNVQRGNLTVPRRPPWDEHTTPHQLDAREREALLRWRRGLAQLQEGDDLLMTPFERNIEVWRQLWRVIERSDLVVQIVDARNPLLFRCEDLERYVKEVDPDKNNLLLVNKADMMTLEQRQSWAHYFTENRVNYRFFSAEMAREMNEARGLERLNEEEERALKPPDNDANVGQELAVDIKRLNMQDQAKAENVMGRELINEGKQRGASSLVGFEATRIITTDELEALFLQHSPKIATSPDGQSRKTEIGLVGYPNVGKSSTINALIGAKRVSVSATPGKTKHFQTIHLSDNVVLCDCPGLVFPNFATTKAELVCSGILPIDQLREFTGPAALVAQRIPQAFLEAIYGMKIDIKPVEEGGTGIPSAEEMLAAYAIARSFSTQGLGQPDVSRAARIVLKDYVKGKLPYCHPPPADPPIDGQWFNCELYHESHLPEKRRAAFHNAEEPCTSEARSDAFSLTDGPDAPSPEMCMVQGEKSRQIDSKFFGSGGNAAHMLRPFHDKYTEQGQAAGKQLSGRKALLMEALERNANPAELRKGRKHFKGNRKVKVRNKGGGYE